MKPKPQSRVQVTGDTIKIIYMLAAAMTIAMLIATVFDCIRKLNATAHNAALPASLRPRNLLPDAGERRSGSVGPGTSRRGSFRLRLTAIRNCRAFSEVAEYRRLRQHLRRH